MQEQNEKEEVKEENSEEDEEIGVIEYSPCGRWQKRAEEVHQKELSGIDATYLAMDLEEGVEVVWNEIEISLTRNVQRIKDEINSVLSNLVNFTHPYIINFHDYWIDNVRQPPRVIFITEYMSAGSLMSFLRKSQKTVRSSLRTWKRWCGQILCALSLFHQNKPNPIIHGNLSCDGIFMQHNGIIKICAVAPDAIYRGVKTGRLPLDRLHYIAPEYASESATITTASDIYSFGMCALQLYAYISGLCDDSTKLSSKDKREKLIELIEHPEIKEIITMCLSDDPSRRPSARDLLLHSCLIDIPPLRYISLDKYMKHSGTNLPTPTVYHKSLNITGDRVFAEVGEQKWIYSQLNKTSFGEMTDSLRDGKFPLLCSKVFTNDEVQHPTIEKVVEFQNIASFKPNVGGGDPSSPLPGETEEEISRLSVPIEETRMALSIECSIKRPEESSATFLLSLLIKFADKTNRQLSCEVMDGETAYCLTRELLDYCLINEADFDNVESAIDSCITQISNKIVE